jgi:hypothetical protein
MQLARSLPEGPGTQYFRKFKIPVVDPHWFTVEHRAYNRAVDEAFVKWCNYNHVTPKQVAKSEALARQFVQDIMSQPGNKTVASYLSKNVTFMGGKALKAAVILGTAFGGAAAVYNVYAGGNDVVKAAQVYEQDIMRGAGSGTLDLDAINVAVAVQTMTGDYFVTMAVLSTLLE